jgi:uncharacterized membrane protein (UPF0127 family)
MRPSFQLVDGRGEAVVSDLKIAAGFWRRFAGLQLRRRARFPAGCGILLVPCNSIHTMFVRFPLDVTFLDKSGKVLAVRRGVRPWRIVAPVKGARAVLETPADAVEIAVGDVLRIRAGSSAQCSLPRRLRGWEALDTARQAVDDSDDRAKPGDDAGRDTARAPAAPMR